MSIESVLAQLRSSCEQVPEPFVFDADRHIAPRPAAVIVPILDYTTHATVLLTKRTSHLTAHAGQICFPGGMREEEDHNLLATALRECEEELAIPASAITIIGEGRGRITATGFHITPFIGHIQAPITYIPDTSEVESAFEMPLEMALRKASYQRMSAMDEGVKRRFDVLNYEGHCIWGATAGILRDICRMHHGEEWEDPTC